MLIKQSDYHRIYKVINTLARNEGADSKTASMYFSTFGAYILRQHFKINAVPKCGLAAYNLDGSLLLFASHRDDGYVSGAEDNFHCWIEADGWAIDFMAPNFVDLVDKKILQSRMFQKPMSTAANDINSLNKSGDFYYKAEGKAAKEHFSDWQKQPMIGDVATIAVQWFRKAPRSMAAAISVSDNNNKSSTLLLTGHSLSGNW